MALTIISREQWGAQAAKAVEFRPLDDITAAVFHYADQPHPGIDLTDEEAAVRAIQQFHMLTKGWFDVAYHALVGDTGNVYEGRPVHVNGAHCLDFNWPSVGICFLTNDGISPAAGAAAVEWLQTVEYVGLHRQVDVFAHSEKVATNCPGPILLPWVESVRSEGGPLHKAA